jgi:predicted ATPase
LIPDCYQRATENRGSPLTHWRRSRDRLCQKQLTLEALLDQLEGLAAQQPILLAYEDAHWLDATTQELLGLTIERIPRLPVLALITFRPEFQPPWTGPRRSR